LLGDKLGERFMTLARYLTPYLYLQITQEVFIAALRSHTGNGKGNLCQVTESYVISQRGAEKMFVFHLEKNLAS